ncbi:MAG: radical SAM protein [Candidatus Krumholzibacteriota bacterium]|nr:radical SAM protein [Candidatus Krumholzibacteriota bacterium]
MTAARKLPPHDFLSRETRLVAYPAPERGAPSVYVGYPADYATGMANLGFQFLFDALSRTGTLRVERFFLGCGGQTIETGAPIAGADLLLVSVSWEEDYVNLVRILAGAGIEPLRERRTVGPAIIAGGAAVSGNPYPVSAIVDAVVLGEGERPIAGLCRAVEETAGAGKNGLLETITGIEGVMPAGGRGRFARPADPGSFPHSAVLSPQTAFPGVLLVEIARGCPGRCAFCLATALYGAYRPMPRERFAAILDLAAGKSNRAGLVSTAVAAHPDLAGLVNEAQARGMVPAFGSLRAEDIDGETAGLIGGAGARSVALAPESGSERLRALIGKRVADVVYLDAARLLAAAGVRRFTLYLLVGLPGEGNKTDEETDRFLAAFAAAAAPAKTAVHVNTVVPKAWTPMQFHAVPGVATLDARMRRIEAVCRRLGFAVRRKNLRSSLRQAVFSAGNEAVGRAAVRLAAGGVSWRRALLDEGVDPDFIHRPRGIDKPLPWDSIEGPVARASLERRWQRLEETK